MDNIVIASDHVGFKLKEIIKEYLKNNNFKIVDCGSSGEDAVDYPDYAYKLVEQLKNKLKYRGILICGSGIGMSIAANRFPYIRAALCTSPEMAKMARRHNDANVLVLGERIINQSAALECVEEFLNTEFAGMHHQARIDKLNKGVL